jgi:hypothetical protein
MGLGMVAGEGEGGGVQDRGQKAVAVGQAEVSNP